MNDIRYTTAISRLRQYEELMRPMIDKWCVKVVEDIVDMDTAEAAVNQYNLDWFSSLPFNIKIKQQLAAALYKGISQYSDTLGKWYGDIVDGNPDSLDVIEFKETIEDDQDA